MMDCTEEFEMDFIHDDWFAGFTDGEGSFSIVGSGGLTSLHLMPIFCVVVTIADGAILHELHEAFGGRVYTKKASLKHRYTSRPVVNWLVRDKQALRGLVDYFDAHPLRSKKAEDYSVWRRGVLAYIKDGNSSTELLDCRRDLDGVRPSCGRRAIRFSGQKETQYGY
jgi:hypothetical protein